VSDLPRSAVVRAARLASLPVGIAGRAAWGLGKRVGGKPAEIVAAELQARTAEQLFSVLGQLKGGAMKFGQALSIFESAFPEEMAAPYRATLTKLQDSAPPLPADTVHRVLAEQLGPRWRRSFVEFDDVPVAAASIGQVHRGVWRDGRLVAVKIQYPGAGPALLSDLAQVSRVARVATAWVPGIEIGPILAELKSRMAEELDYRLEARSQETFAKGFDGDTHFLIPHVIKFGERVIVSEWIDGDPLSRIIASGTEAERDLASQRYMEFLLAGPDRVGLLHADPHPGNFMALDDGRLGMIDYGSVAALPGGIPPVLVRILRHIADSDPAAMMALLRAEGFVVGDVAADDVLRALGALGDPLRVERFHFHRGWTTGMGGHALETGRALTLPPRHLMVVRVLSGWMNILAQLDCTVDVRGVAQRWLPGFARRQAC
jgi:predicted unusual protein kinase regulating ubiquinone biosynthesis (AarF/ABC1/UbiB family)